MEGFQMLQPASVLAIFTLTVLLLVPIKRVRALFAGRVAESDFKYGESDRVPPEVCIPNRNYMNLLELPVLFYAASLLAFVIHQSDATLLGLAWAYVGLRIVHSIIHLTYNRVLHRGLVFAISNVVLVVMWIRILLVIW
ncbi:membrane-associated protein in eicosanoid and glutathione metabolism (mapeg) [Alcanivorax sp. S71-1-4]|uniref:MAPEG family protein n=1 Tax=Alcanivorax sp. S71-1-4 TaxID=1177159 RepID=UPI001356D4D8|nr:MAPEG family protein [Alcanivorax sp. S71-1-4]KAF0811180.1 membrane-associated protein in eicosanoid and glutathione metabolism (mapeg) [Alcanivorax sp. S71-1-4]